MVQSVRLQAGDTAAHALLLLAPLFQRRHNTIQDAVVAALPSSDNDDQEVLVNRRPTTFTSNLRVDLTIIDRSAATVTMVDFKSPIETNPEAFEDARRRNAEKYADLAEAYRRLGFSVTLDAVCVGALGSWDPANDSILRRLGIPRSRSNGLKRKACREVLHLSRNIWVQHCTGVPQTF